MKLNAKILSLMLGTALVMSVPAAAKTLTTGDGVLSIEAPSDQWAEVTDPNHWFVITDGKDTITIEHVSNGETLPAVAVADDHYQAVYNAFVSTINEVFIVEGKATTAEDLKVLMDAIGTVQVLKYNTKTAIPKETEAAKTSDFTLNPINGTYYVTTDQLNVRNGCSTDDAVVGTLYYGEEVTVNGSVLKGGQEYGWYQIAFNGSTAYVSSSFLSQTKPADKAPAKTAQQSSSDSISVYRADGSYFGELVGGQDGHYYVGEVPFDSNGDGTFFGGAGAGMTIYTYEAWAKINNVSTGSESRVQCEYCGQWFTAGNDYRNHVMAAHGSASDETSTQYGLESQGSRRPVTITSNGGAWFDGDGVEYYMQGDGTFIDANGDVFDVVW